MTIFFQQNCIPFVGFFFSFLLIMKIIIFSVIFVLSKWYIVCNTDIFHQQNTLEKYFHSTQCDPVADIVYHLWWIFYFFILFANNENYFIILKILYSVNEILCSILSIFFNKILYENSYIHPMWPDHIYCTPYGIYFFYS